MGKNHSRSSNRVGSRLFLSLYKNYLFFFLLFVLFGIVFLYSWLYAKEGFSNEETIDYYVITMKTPDRMKNIETQQELVEPPVVFQLFDAVKGDELNLDDYDNISPGHKLNTKIRKREIALSMTNVQIYKKIQKEGKKGYTVILEDDFALIPDFYDFEKKIKEVIPTQDFDILYLENVSNNQGEPISSSVCEIDTDKKFYGTLGYVIKNQNVDNVLRETEYIKAAIDNQLQEAIYENKLKGFTCCPFIIKQSGASSTIQIDPQYT